MSKLINGDYSFAYPNFLGNQNLSSDIIVDSTTGIKITTELANINNELNQNMIIGTTQGNTIIINSGSTTYTSNEVIKIKDNTVGALKFQCNDAGSTDLMSISTLNGVESITINKHLELLGDVDAGSIVTSTITCGTTDSSSSTTGSIICAGGVGISKNLNIDGIIKCSNITMSNSATTGALVISGGVGIGAGMTVNGSINASIVNAMNGLTCNSITDSINSYGTGSITTLGGIGVKKSVTIGENLNTFGNIIAGGSINGGSINGGAVNASGTISAPTINSSGTISSNSFIGGAYTGSGSISGGQIFTSVGISLPTIGGVVAILNYYEAGYSFPMLFQSSITGGSTALINVVFTRIGNLCTMYIPNMAINTNGGYINNNPSYYIPARFRPINIYNDYVCHTINASAYLDTGSISIGNNGQIIIYKSMAVPAFTAGAGSGIANVSNFTYTIS